MTQEQFKALVHMIDRIAADAVVESKMEYGLTGGLGGRDYAREQQESVGLAIHDAMELLVDKEPSEIKPKA